MARRRRRTVYGEPVDVLLGALLKMDAGKQRQVDGSFLLQATLQREEGNALWRGLMRAEAALLRKDADSFPQVDRSDGDRQGAAFLALALQVVDAAERLGIRSSAGAAPVADGVTLGACRPAGPATS